MKPATRRLLTYMLAHRGEWLSGNRLFEVAGTRYGARLFELAHDHGYSWEKRYVKGTRVPQYRLLGDVQLVRQRDRGCVAARAVQGGSPAAIRLDCRGPLDVDHVRASGGLGMKSPTHRTNLVVLCRHHHDAKTQYGKTWRPLLLAYLARVEPS